MQSEIIFDNKKFLSSREAARLVKYTSDYVGQLCRQAKVEGRRVGRVGYVSESSILAHKNENDSHEKHHSVGKIFAGTHDAEVRGESIPDESGGLKNASGIREGAGGEGGESRQKDEFAQEIFSAKHDDAKYHTNVLSGESHKPLVFKDISDAISDTRDNARNNDRVEDEKSRVYKYSKDERPLLPVIGKQTNPAVWGVIPPTFEFKKFSGKFSDAKKAPISRSGNFVYRDLFKKTSAFAMAVVLIVIPFVAGNYLKEKTEYILAVVKNGADRASSFYDFSFVATERIVKETYVFASRVPLYFETGLMTSAVYSLDKYDELSESVSEIYDNPKLAFEKTGRVALLTTWTISKNASSSYLRFVSSASESVVSSFENAYRGIYNARHSFLNQAKTMARSSLSSTASSATGGLRGFFGTVRDFVAGLFGGQQKESEEEEKIFASESPSENEQAKKDADDKVKVATNSKNQTTSSSVTVVEKPQTIIRQVTENVTYSGITVDKFNSVIKEIEDRLATISIDISKAQTSTSGNATYINNVYNTVGTMGRIEHLKDLDLETPTIRGATITGSTGTFTGNISVGGALTVTGTATSTLVAGIDIEGGCFAIDGTCISGSGGSGSGTVNSGTSGRLAYYAGTGTEVSETSANLFWDNTNGLLGLGTTTPGQKLSVAGDILGNNIIGSYFTATSSTATSTFAGGFTINTSGFVYDWSSGFVGIATTTPGSLLSVGDTSGINFTTATSTWNSTGGINLASGCFAINGTCISGSGGGGDISSVSNSDGTLTIDPTTGDVVASLNLTNANTWSALQIFSQASTTRLSVFDTAYFGATATSTFNSAGVLTLASALAETSGGTGQSSYTEGDILYSDSSNSLSKLGIGTGGFVLGVSNGVPAWVATTTLSTISGTLSVAKGGTGLTTFGGTNTLLYTSSADTLTSNSNFVFDGTNLGVGTTTPYAKLSVVGPVVAEYFHATSTIATSTFAGGLSVGNGGLNYDWYSGITSVDSLELGALSFPENSGKVSWIDLPVTDSADEGIVQSYTAQIDNNPLLTIYAESDGSGGIQNSRVSVGTTSPTARLSIWGSGSTSATNAFQITNSASTTLATVADDGTAYLLGNVGIGTAEPNVKLHINDSSNSFTRFQLTNSTSGSASTDGFQLQQEGSETYIWNFENSNMRFGTNNTTRIIINSSGNVGIGTTSPGQKLSVAGDILGNNIIGQYFTATSSTATSTFAGGFAVGTSGLVYDHQTGNVGVGTAAPVYDLDVTGEIKASATLRAASSYLDNSTLFFGTNSNHTIDGTASESNALTVKGTPFTVHTGGAETLRIDISGNVGLSSTTPSARLSITQDDITAASGIWMEGTDGDFRAIYMSDTSGNMSFFGGDTGTTNTATLSAAGAWTDAASFSFLKEQREVLSLAELLDILDDTTIEKYKLKSEVAAHGDAADTKLGIILDEAHTLLSDKNLEGDIFGYSPIRTASAAFRGVQVLTDIIDISSATTSSASIYIDATGRVGIGTSTPNYELTVGGDVAATGFVNISTKTAKKDIKYLTDDDKRSISQKIKDVGIATYNYIGESGCSFDSDSGREGSSACATRMGLIAEEAPVEVLSADGKGVDLYKLSTFILAGVQEQEKRIANLELRIDEIEEKLSASGKGNSGSEGIVGFLAGLGTKISNGLAEFKNVVVAALTVGSAEKPSGITIYDEVTGEPYCFSIANGSPKTSAGECKVATNNQQPTTENTTPTSGHPSSDEEGAGGGAEPVITINGNNPAYVEINSTYVDLGAQVEDDRDENLGLKAVVVNDDAPQTDYSYIDISEISINTATSTSYKIHYVATDTDGNTATSTRDVIVENTEISNSPNSPNSPNDADNSTPITNDGANDTNEGDTTLITNEDTNDTNNTNEEEQVADTEKPVITLNGEPSETIEKGSEWSDEGAEALDDTDGDITADIVVTGVVDADTAGEYILRYNVSDTAGNEADEVTRVVTVSDSAPENEEENTI